MHALHSSYSSATSAPCGPRLYLLVVSLACVVSAIGCNGGDEGERGSVTWTVSQDGAGDFISVAECVSAASSSDTCLVSPGTYRGTVEIRGKSLTLRSTAGPEVTVLDAGGKGPVIALIGQAEGSPSLIEGFTITGGSAPQGGGLSIQEASPTIDNCIIAHNTALLDGGGVFCFSSDSKPLLRHTTLSHNEAGQGEPSGGGRGAAICALYSSPTLFNCLVHSNKARQGSQGGRPEGGLGGALYAAYAEAVLVKNSTLTANTAEGGDGGAIYVHESSVAVEDSILWGNTGDRGIEGFLDRRSDRDGQATLSLDHVDLDDGIPMGSLLDTTSGQGCRQDPTRCAVSLEGAVYADPLFVPQGSFYLAHKSGQGQTQDSPCIDAGSTSPQEAGLDSRTTCTCGEPDNNDTVDLGYHYSRGTSEPGKN